MFTTATQTSHEVENTNKNEQIARLRKGTNLSCDIKHGFQRPMFRVNQNFEMRTLSYFFRHHLSYRKQFQKKLDLKFRTWFEYKSNHQSGRKNSKLFSLV